MTETDFKTQVFLFTEYEIKMLEQFFDYWSEPNKRGKMRWQLEKTWDLSRRLKRWSINNINWNHANSKKGTSVARIDALRNWGT